MHLEKVLASVTINELLGKRNKMIELIEINLEVKFDMNTLPGKCLRKVVVRVIAFEELKPF